MGAVGSSGLIRQNNDVRLKVDYKERKLNARAEVHLQQSLGKDAGALMAQLELPIDASSAKLMAQKHLVNQLERQARRSRRSSTSPSSIWRASRSSRSAWSRR